ncbi:MAG: TRAP transporter substrate-binding protein [Rhodospirillales bacterium]
MMGYRTLVRTTLYAAVAVAAVAPAAAQETTLKLHHLQAPMTAAHRLFIAPWAKDVEAASGGKLKVQVFPSMQLGGKPEDLAGQVRDGVVDIVWTLPGYTPAAFTISDVLELPFMVPSGIVGSQAFMEFGTKAAAADYQEYHVLVLHMHDAGEIHSKKPILKLEDVQGLKARVPSQAMGEAVKAWGGVPVYLPIPRVAEGLTRNEVEGIVTAWNVMRPLKLIEVTGYHTSLRMYSARFAMLMNKASYQKLSPELRKLLDDKSGMALARKGGEIWDQEGKASYDAAVKRGNKVADMDGAERARWLKGAEPAYEQYVKDMNAKGLDGRKLLAEARAAVAKYEKK